ncbi:hypothetical protein KSC_027090 [Ktedonobacter sp. SOSP1-52]|nr:hypothetical protein KSC_027090 [Ktedonobacter sp. SOSP1-52]
MKIFDLPQYTLFGETAFRFQFRERFGRGSVFVYVDDPWFPGMGSGERFQKELLGGLGLSHRAEEEIERLSVRINRSIQIHPLFFDRDVCFIGPPEDRDSSKHNEGTIVRTRE